jgi:hypothetical protein
MIEVWQMYDNISDVWLKLYWCMTEIGYMYDCRNNLRQVLQNLCFWCTCINCGCHVLEQGSWLKAGEGCNGEKCNLGPKVHEECFLRVDVALYIAILYCRKFCRQRSKYT